jgi:hypothetical protein
MKHKLEDIERVARAMCQRIGRDPDLMVSAAPPWQFAGPRHMLYAVDPKRNEHPMWRVYSDLAAVALDEVVAALDAVAFKARRD